jgi:hypothetical protein
MATQKFTMSQNVTEGQRNAALESTFGGSVILLNTDTNLNFAKYDESKDKWVKCTAKQVENGEYLGFVTFERNGKAGERATPVINCLWGDKYFPIYINALIKRRFNPVTEEVYIYVGAVNQFVATLRGQTIQEVFEAFKKEVNDKHHKGLRAVLSNTMIIARNGDTMNVEFNEYNWLD